MRKKYLHKKFWSIYREILSGVKCNSKIPNIYYDIKFRKSIIRRWSIKKLFSKISQYSQENTCVGISFLIKMLWDVHSCSFIKKRLQHLCFPVNIAKFLRAPVLKNICEWLFEHFPTWTNKITSNIDRKWKRYFFKSKIKNHSKT